jgi:hypothetical protein
MLYAQEPDATPVKYGLTGVSVFTHGEFPGQYHVAPKLSMRFNSICTPEVALTVEAVTNDPPVSLDAVPCICKGSPGLMDEPAVMLVTAETGVPLGAWSHPTVTEEYAAVKSVWRLPALSMARTRMV